MVGNTRPGRLLDALSIPDSSPLRVLSRSDLPAVYIPLALGALMMVGVWRMQVRVIEAEFVVNGDLIPWAAIGSLEATDKGVRLNLPREREGRRLIVIERPVYKMAPEATRRLQSIWEARAACSGFGAAAASAV